MRNVIMYIEVLAVFKSLTKITQHAQSKNRPDMALT